MALDRIRTYSELIQLPTYRERFEYLKLDGIIGEDTFGKYGRRFYNQRFYKSPEWRRIKRQIILRDNACDMGIPEYELTNNRIYIHHMNPITDEDIINRTPYLINPEFLICVSFETHNAIHFGDFNVTRMAKDPAQRYPNDQCPWR